MRKVNGEEYEEDRNINTKATVYIEAAVSWIFHERKPNSVRFNYITSDLEIHTSISFTSLRSS
jgi:hypothetical protein